MKALSRAWIVILFLLAGCSGGSGRVSTSELASCGSGELFTALPMALADFRGLVPLGTLNPSGHTLPTDHLYFYIRLTDPANSSSDPASVNVYAPGNIRITEVSVSEHLSANPPYSDYTITFYPCEELHAYFGHIQSLSSSFSGQVGSVTDNCETYSTGGESFSSCSKTVSIDVAAGALLGTAGRKSQLALDFGAYDSRITPEGFANQSRFTTSYPYAVCPVDYFSASLKNNLETRFSSYTGATQRTADPVCGEVGQDVSETAQGLWFLPNTATYPEDPHLALAHDNITPSIGVFSVGTSLTGVDSGVYTFTPVSSGFINRDFSGVTADGNRYCYETGEGVVFMLQLANSATLHIQKLDQANCDIIPDFDSATVTYER
ncbi:MAG: hypothetical protein HYY43_05430 [Deltaproteobacteria bacterium]|nr:hypothetical protein [Deltaproteobacteria bacterium]MBI2975012.1 hypothetical protein [Deltaproteobacteria bacterium]